MKNYKTLFCVAIVCLMQVLFFASCSSDGDKDGQPVITGIRSIENPDSLFTDGERWQLIVIMGHHLDGAKEIYINDQKISFNPTYVTSTNIILSIPEKLKLVGEDPSLRPEIRLVTDHGTATYAFHVNSPAPNLISYTADWVGEEPLVPGQEFRIKGENFYEVQSLYISEINPYEVDEEGNLVEPEEPVTKYEITEFTVNATFDEITALMPASFPDKGYIVLECYSGPSVIGFRSVKPTPPVIKDISSDMPVWGEPCTIYGKDFDDIVAIVIGKDEITIPAEDISANEDNTQLTFSLPTLPEKGGRLILITEQGRDTVPFYQKSRVLIDFDNYGRYFWGGTDSSKPVNETTANNKPANTSGKFQGIEGTTQIENGWWGPLFLGDAQITDIPDDTPIEKVEFRYECYMHYPYVEGMDCWFIFFTDTPTPQSQYSFDGYKDRITGECEQGRWMCCSIPMEKFTSAATFGEIKQNLTSVYLHVCNPKNVQDIAVYFDNFRMYVKP